MLCFHVRMQEMTYFIFVRLLSFPTTGSSIYAWNVKSAFWLKVQAAMGEVENGGGKPTSAFVQG